MPGGIVRTRTKGLIVAAGSVLVVVITVLGVLQLLPADDTAPVAARDEPEYHFSATEVTLQFLDALTSGEAAAAGELTDDPAGAGATITDVWRTLAAKSAVASRDEIVEPPAGGDAVQERFTLTWDLGAGRAWAYETSLRVVRAGEFWRVQWRPALVHPRLSAGRHLVLHDRTGLPAVLDRDRQPLLTWTGTGPAATDRAVAPLLLPGMGRIATRRQSNGWYVALSAGSGRELAVLHGSRAAALASTLSQPVQGAAQRAVAAQRLPAMLVAIEPSTGDILAVAQNAAAGREPVALNGLFPPGSTFKVATAAAILEAGDADVDTVVDCPGSVTVGQRTVRNADFALGAVPLRTAFAQSCNTTFAMQAANLPPDALPRAADQLGLGADFTVPGIITEAGSVPAAADTTQQVENSIGQGTVQASCFGLAMMVATVAADRAVTPRLWRALRTTVNTGYQAPRAGVLASLRTMMRAVVTEGRGRALGKYGNVHGKTGTAQVDDGTRAHGWFAGYRDDVAFATLVLDGSTSTAAVAVSGRFLGAIDR